MKTRTIKAADLFCGAGRTEEMIHKQIGNAVPPKLAEAHARAALQLERRAA